MERKIGEIFEYNGEWYQCLEEKYCNGCVFRDAKCDDVRKILGNCSVRNRSDKISVIFKKLEKVGDPFTCNIHGDERLVWMQEYKLYDVNFCKGNALLMFVVDYKHKRIAIEIKQTKEDMEENKLNLKPFDIQKAREGKPVCTRDGRKARIICFDRKGYNMFPIVALIMNGDRESDIYTYRPNGTWDNSGNESDKDLMMIPEKKEGWININKDAGLFKSREEAERYCTKDYATVRVEFEI